ncbi:unnamed protein product, partial [Prorocentrum cordatum]
MKAAIEPKAWMAPRAADERDLAGPAPCDIIEVQARRGQAPRTMWATFATEPIDSAVCSGVLHFCSGKAADCEWRWGRRKFHRVLKWRPRVDVDPTGLYFDFPEKIGVLGRVGTRAPPPERPRGGQRPPPLPPLAEPPPPEGGRAPGEGREGRAAGAPLFSDASAGHAVQGAGLRVTLLAVGALRSRATGAMAAAAGATLCGRSSKTPGREWPASDVAAPSAGHLRLCERSATHRASGADAGKPPADAELDLEVGDVNGDFRGDAAVLCTEYGEVTNYLVSVSCQRRSKGGIGPRSSRELLALSEVEAIGIIDIECDSDVSTAEGGARARRGLAPLEVGKVKEREALLRIAAGGVCAGQVGVALLAALAARDSPIGAIRRWKRPFSESTVRTLARAAAGGVPSELGRLLSALVDRVDEETGTWATAPSLDFAAVLGRKRLSYQGEEVSLPEALALQELLPGLPPKGEAASVDPLAIAAPEVVEALLRPERACNPDGSCVAQPSARAHASPGEWALIVRELLDRGVFEEIAFGDIAVVGGQPVLNGAFGVVKSGDPLPPATRVLRLIINMIPSNRVQRPIDGDIAMLPVGGEHHVVILGDGEVLLWSSDDIKGCFHVFRPPEVWRPWMALSAPVDPVPLGGASGPPVWVAVAVAPMGWLSAVGIAQHLSRRIVLQGAPGHACPSESTALRRGAAYPLQLHQLPRAWWKVYVDNVDFGEIVAESEVRNFVGQVSIEQLAVRHSLDRWGIRRNESKVVERATAAVSMGSGVDGVRGRVAPSLPMLLQHLALTACVLTRADCRGVWVAAATGRLCFDFGHWCAAFGVLDQIWREIAHWKGHRPLSRPGGDELIMACSLAPLLATDLRAHLFPWPHATDASEHGGGTCVAAGLTRAGWEAASEARQAPLGHGARPVPPRQAAEGGAQTRQGAEAGARGARPAPSLPWVDVSKITLDMVVAVRRSTPGATGITAFWRLPCQDISGLGCPGIGFEGICSSLFWEIPRVSQFLQVDFGDLPWIDVVECVAGMAAEACYQISEGLGRHPILIDAAGISRVRRPRLYWCNFPVGAVACRQQSPIFDAVVLAADPGPAEVWLEADACWDLKSGCRLPAFTRASSRAQPPPAPVELQCRFPPNACRDQFTVKVGVGDRRVLRAGEREDLMGFWPGHAAPSRPTSACADDAARCALIGSSSHVGVASWLLAQGLCAAGLIEAPVSATTVQTAFVSELRMRRSGNVALRVLPLVVGRAAVELRSPLPEEGGEVSAARALMCGLLQHADHRGSRIRLDVGLPFRAKAWPRAPIATDRWQWQAVLSHQWRWFGRHIDELEMQEVLAALKWFARKGDRRHSRLGILVDSQVVLSVCAKGRSSSRRLNHLVKRIDAQILPCSERLGGVRSEQEPFDDPQDVDQSVMEYLEKLWSEGEPQSFANDLVAGLRHFIPRLRRQLNGSWCLLGALARADLPARAPPLPTAVAIGLTGYAAAMYHLDVGVLWLVGFHCFLRSGEMLGLRAMGVTFADDLSNAVLNLGLAKTGKRQGATESVTVTDRVVVRALRSLVQQRRLAEPLARLSGPRQRALFRQVCVERGLRDHKCSLYLSGVAGLLTISATAASLIALS